jgi:hypothetical protein
VPPHVFNKTILLLRSIARRVRQRASVIFKPNPIAHVDIGAAERASPEMLGLGQSRSADLFAHHGAARLRLVHRHDRGHMHTSKKIRPRFPEARSNTARDVHPAALPSWFISSRQMPLSNLVQRHLENKTGFFG